MAWSDPVGAYCERFAPGLLGEPLNTLSNIAFVAAAFALLRLHAKLRQRREPIPTDIAALPWLVCGVALCSMLFHTLATRWAGWLDSLSILVYCAVGLYSFLRHATALGNTTAVAAAVAFVVASLGTSRLVAPGTLNGSAAYLPNLLTLLAVTAYLGLRQAPAFRGFALATVVFAIALMLRTLDRAWCSALPIGTHFLWHLLNPVAMYLCVRAVVETRRS
jgi:hypothetical protein